MGYSATPVDRPSGQPDRVLKVTKRRGKWEVHEGLQLDYPLIVETPGSGTDIGIDPAKQRDKSTGRLSNNQKYTRHNFLSDQLQMELP